MFRANKTVLKSCKIYQMLKANARKKHLSFHTPGHKNGKWDITELVYSDNLSSPRGCIAEAEKEISEILGAYKSFILTDGSTSGVLSMLYAAKQLGVKTVAVFENSHKSIFNACKITGIVPLVYTQTNGDKIPNGVTMSALKEDFSSLLNEADALFITSPDYYGNVAELSAMRAYCEETGKLLLVDGAHGGHLHFDKDVYAGTYADMWVDGVHKSLPALTQGAVVSAKNKKYAAALQEGVNIFRTTSPSYPIMASVEYAVKYPQNKALEEVAKGYIQSCPRIYKSKDWTKLCALIGENAFDAEKALQEKGIYPEFCDGNVVMFYLSPATTKRQFCRLKKELNRLFEEYPYISKKAVERIPTPFVLDKNKETEWVEMEKAEGRICAAACGMFPPCTPFIYAGERIQKGKIDMLKNAANVYGLVDEKILVQKEEE